MLESSETILVATDFSDRATRALAVAVKLCQRMGADLHLLHVVEPIDDPRSGDPETEEFHSQLLDKAERRLHEAADHLAGLQITTQALLGPRAPSIQAVAAQREVSMVVMGCPAHPSEQPPSWAGTGQLVILNAELPILLVP